MALQTLTLRTEGGVARIGLDRPEVRNAINQTVVDELTSLLDRLAADPSIAVVVLTGEGGKAFAAGADIAELRGRKSPQALMAINARMFQHLEDFPRPTIAAINGYALGGGLELALACDLRIAARSAKLGLPEVSLGIFPGAGGTWRLPRLIGLGRAKELVFTGRIIDAEEALALGLVEQICPDEALEAEALALAKQIAANAPLALQVAKLSFQAAARGGDPTVAEKLGQALLFDSDEKQRRMDAFLARRKTKAGPPMSLDLNQIQRVAVLGAGTMGHGIAQLAAQAGFEVKLYDVTRAAAERGLLRIGEQLDRAIAKGKLAAEERAPILARIEAVESLVALEGSQVVIEAVPETLALKQRLLGELATRLDPEALLASNTSSLSLTRLAQGLPHPERVVGMHFFNPPQLMKLLEIVVGAETSSATTRLARALGERLGKEVIEVRDSPGFASSRLGICLAMEAIRMLEEGVASAADIDKAMRLGYNHPMGPLELTDHVGLDVRLTIAEYLELELASPRFHPPELLRRLVGEGKLGKKTGEGFYVHKTDRK